MAAFIVAFVAGCLLVFTTHKLDVMARLRGWKAGYPARTMIVGAEVRRFPNGGHVVALSDPLDPKRRPFEIQVTLERFGELRIGSETRVRCIDHERQCYGPGSVYIDDGNFGFDRSLRGLECIVLGLALARLLFVGERHWRALRAYRAEMARRH